MPIEVDEASKALPSASTATGADGMTTRQLRSIPASNLASLFDIILYCGSLPDRLCLSRTVFVSRKTGAAEQGDFRLIAVAPVLTRCLHKILASRLKSGREAESFQMMIPLLPNDNYY